MGVNKVTFGTRTLVDLTKDTVVPAAMAKGYSAHDKAGNLVIGAAEDIDPILNQLRTDVDGKVLNKGFTVTVPASGWSSTAPYTQTVSVSGMLAAYDVIFAPNITASTSAASEKSIKAACGYISVLETLNGSIKLTCLAKKPTVDIPLTMKVA